MEKDSEAGRKELEKRLTDTRKSLEDQLTRIKGSVPDFDKFIAEYKKEGQKLVDEIKADETIKKFIDF